MSTRPQRQPPTTGLTEARRTLVRPILGTERPQQARCTRFSGVLIVLALLCHGWMMLAGVPAVSAQEVTSGPKVPLTDADRAWLKAHPDIQLGYTDTFQPEVIVDSDGTHRGILVDLLDELNRRLGVNIGLRIYPGSTVIGKAKGGEVDGILSLHPEYAGRLGLLSTQAHTEAYPAAFTRRNVSLDRPSDLAGKRVAIIDEVFFSEQLVKQHGEGATVVKVKTALEGLRKVDNGQADLFLGASLNAYLITKYQLFGLACQYIFYDHPVPGAVGVRSDWPELVGILNKGIASFSKAELEAISARWVQGPTSRLSIEFTAEENAWIAQNHAVRVRVGEYPPNYFVQDGKACGIAIDMLNAVSERTGIRFDFIVRSPAFAEDLAGLVKHEGPDLLPSLQKTAEREKTILFTRAYLSSPRFIFTRDDVPFVATIERLSGKTVAVEEGFLVQTWLARGYPAIHLLPCASSKDALSAVASGRAFAYIGPLRATASMINRYGLQNLKAATPSPLPDGLTSMGVRDDWPELRDIIDKILDAMPADKRAAIINKWSTVRVEYGIRPGHILRWALGAAAGGVLIVLLFVAWNRQLARGVRRRTAELTRSQERFRATFEQAAVGIAHVAPDGHLLRVNQKFCEITGYTVAELLERSFQDITHPDDLVGDEEHIARILTGEASSYSMEKRYVRQDGDPVWCNLTASLLRDADGKPVWFVSVVEDITERKQAEKRLHDYQQRLKALASELTLTEERERRRIAADLHDGIAQSLAFARIQLTSAGKVVSEKKLAGSLDEVSESLREAIEGIQNIVLDLSSPSMNEIGLAAALSEWLEEQVQRRHGIKTTFVDECGWIAMDDDARAVLFRNVRELATNAIKHARASELSVHMSRSGDSLLIVVEDDGVGFDPDAESEGGGGERASGCSASASAWPT